MMKNKTILFAIILIAIFFRFFNLSTNPPSLTWDEVAWGYNAYALGIDGRDEFGRFLPLDYLESFGDFKPPVYAYLDILPVKIFGLNEFAVRFPSALFGVLTVFITYFLVIRLFHNSKRKELYALVSAGLLAISPWHILLSRAAFEANVATFFLVFGVYSFLKAVQEKPSFLVLSAISFVLSMYTFNTARIVAPLLVLLLAITYRKKLWKLKKHSVAAIIIGIIVILPTLTFLFSSQARLRYEEVNIFSNIEVIKTSNQQIANDDGAWWSKIIHNRRVYFAQDYLKHYLDHFAPSFLFIKGDGNPKFSAQEIGQMYLWELPFLIIGTLFLIRKKEGKWFIVPLWLLLAIIPAATARETPHALRIETSLPTFQILVAYGIVNTYFLLHKFRKIFIPALSMIVLFFIVYFIHVYFVQYPWRFSGEWQYGYKESIAYVSAIEKNYDQVIVSDTLGRPYIYYLFYMKVAPEEFRRTAKVDRDAFGFVTVEGFGKYKFSKAVDLTPKEIKTLYVISSNEQVPGGLKNERVFKTLNGNDVLRVFSL